MNASRALNARSREAEAALVANMTLSAEMGIDASDRLGELKAEHFTDSQLRAIFEVERALFEDGILPTRFDIEESLRRAGRLEPLAEIVLELSSMLPDPRTERYVAAILEASRRREQARIFYRGLSRLSEGAASVEVAAEVQQSLATFAVAEEKASRGVYDVVSDVHRAADERTAAGRPLGVLTGFRSLDAVTGGLPRKALSILAAQTSHGKTTKALNVAQNAVEVSPDAVVALYSLEMSKQAISDRITARRAGIALNRIRDWKLSDVERGYVKVAREALVDFNRRLFVADRASTITDICADARKKKTEFGLDLVIVDYLQLVAGVDDDSRERVVNQIAWTLFELAKDLDIAVLALSQVTPAANNRRDGRLSIDDLRDCKAIGHHARVVLMLNRPRQADKGNDLIRHCAAILQVEKNSEGETGDIPMHFDGALQEFTEGECRATCRYYDRRVA